MPGFFKKNIITKKVLFSLFVSLLTIPSFAQVHINEIMISNIDGLMVDYDYPDSWIEVFNSSDVDIDLKGYSVKHVDEDGEVIYTIPVSAIVPQHGFIVILCDKVNDGLHTPFRLDADGGTLTLVAPNGEEVSKMEYPAMLAPQVGYARTTDGGSDWQWEKDATPGKSNTGVFCDELLPNPVFSITGKIMSSSETLTISNPASGRAKLLVTLNGEEPTPTNAQVYDSECSLIIDKTMVVRAKLVSDNALSPRSVTQSYIFHPRATHHPIISIVTDSIHYYNEESGIFSSAKTFNGKFNYAQDWRRPANFEFFTTTGQKAVFNQLGETAVGGNSTRSRRQKSLKCYSKKRFGTKHFDATFWDTKPNVTKLKSFVIRNAGNNFSRGRINDGFIQTLFGHRITNLDWQAYTPCIGYINGQYNGIYGLRERSNDDYIWANYDKEDNIEIVASYLEKLARGTSFVDFIKVWSNPNVTFEELDPLMDIDEFLNHFCLEAFSGNRDYVVNNINMWRPKKEGGKWRWITKDVDDTGVANPPYSLDDIISFNSIRFLTNTATEGSIEAERIGGNAIFTKESLFYLKSATIIQYTIKGRFMSR